MALPRRLCVLAALSSLLVACSSHAQTPAPATSTPRPTMAATAAPVPAEVPVIPACGDGSALLASMTSRDKLAQLLMVGVTGAADARAVVENHHVGGIFIGSWTDLSMLSDGSLTDIAGIAGPLPLAVSVDEEGGRVARLSALIGTQPSPRVLAASHTPDEVYNIALARGQAMRKLGITIDFAGAYARGLRDAGLLPVLKHFPGHGHGSGDTHTGSVVTPPLADLQAGD